MNFFNKKNLIFALLIIAMAPSLMTHAIVSNKIRTRPQSLNGARKVSGELPGTITHIPEMEKWYATFSTTFAGQRTMRPGKIADCLFGDVLQSSDKCDSRTLKIQGSFVENRDENALRADDFYLSDQYDGSISFKPTISNFMIDFNLYVGLDEWVQGMYFRIYAPFVHSRTNMNATETINTAFDETTPAAVVNGSRFSPNFLTSENILTSALDFFGGKQPNDTLAPAQTSVVGTNATAPYTLVRNPLLYHKINGNVATQGSCERTCGESLTKNGFGDIRAEWGWDFWLDADYHLGFYLAAAAPTGNRTSSQFLLAPTVGNGKHWELGGGLSGHYLFWKSENEANHFGIYTDVVVTHLFSAKEHRVFDLKDKPLSRYMLASKNVAVTNGGDNQVQGSEVFGVGPDTFVPSLFAGEFTSVANLTAQDVNVSVGAQVDLTAWFNYTVCGFNFDLGYNLWLQTCEKISCASKCGPRLSTETDTWALHGTSKVFGYFPAVAGIPAASQSQGTIIAASQSEATITTAPDIINTGFNIGIDNDQFASAIDSGGVNRQDLTDFTNRDTAVALVQATTINLSNPTEFLSAENIDRDQRSKAMTHKVFGSFNYTWDREGIVPYFGIGGEAEFGSNEKSKKCTTTTTVATNTDCSSCHKCAVSQWGVWAKIGLSFD